MTVGLRTGVRFPTSERNLSLLHSDQTDSGVDQASYPMGTLGSLPGGKAAGA
jgi:hypothetical protein